MGLIAAALSAAVLALGLLLVLLAFRSDEPDDTSEPVATDRSRRLQPIELLCGAGVGVLIVSVTHWVLPALVAAAIGWWVARMVAHRDDSSANELERVEALATWIEQVRDVLMAGDQPVGAIQSTTATCPEPIRPQVRALASRLGRQNEQIVLRQFADELDDPIADLVAAGLLVALTKGGRAERVLSSLAQQARHQAERRKLLEAERAPARREVWWVTGLMTLQLVAGLLFARSSYLAPYRTLSGQRGLCVLLGVFLGLIVYVQRLSRFVRPARFLSLRAMR